MTTIIILHRKLLLVWTPVYVVLYAWLNNCKDEISIGGAISREDRAKLAKDTNNVRKKILEELRNGGMCGSQLDPSAIGHPLEDKFKELVDGYFTKLLTEH